MHFAHSRGASRYIRSRRKKANTYIKELPTLIDIVLMDDAKTVVVTVAAADRMKIMFQILERKKEFPIR